MENNADTPEDRDTIFSSIYNYPWAQDAEFQAGLSSILGRTEGQPERGINHETGLLVKAQCFYFARYEGSACQRSE
jgi:hypothetical protein